MHRWVSINWLKVPLVILSPACMPSRRYSAHPPRPDAAACSMSAWTSSRTVFTLSKWCAPAGSAEHPTICISRQRSFKHPKFTEIFPLAAVAHLTWHSFYERTASWIGLGHPGQRRIVCTPSRYPGTLLPKQGRLFMTLFRLWLADLWQGVVRWRQGAIRLLIFPHNVLVSQRKDLHFAKEVQQRSSGRYGGYGAHEDKINFGDQKIRDKGSRKEGFLCRFLPYPIFCKLQNALCPAMPSC